MEISLLLTFRSITQVDLLFGLACLPSASVIGQDEAKAKKKIHVCDESPSDDLYSLTYFDLKTKFRILYFLTAFSGFN